MKILVTGGAGFIGSHIADALLRDGHEVVVVDNLSTGSCANIPAGARFYQSSILDRRIRHIFKAERPKIVFHEAAQTVVTRSVREPVFDARTNIIGSINLLDACVRYGVSKVIYASSCAAYGTPRYIPIDESHPLDAISPYGVSKQTVERYLKTYREIHGLDYCVLRYSNVYGPRQNPAGEAGVVAIFTRQMLSRERPRIYGDGSKTRSYVYVGDIVRANLLAMHRGQGIFNVGTGEEITDRRIFELVRFFCDYEGEPDYVSERPGEIQRMLLDCKSAREELDWTPKTGLEEGIARTVTAYRGTADSKTIEKREAAVFGMQQTKR